MDISPVSVYDYVGAVKIVIMFFLFEGLLMYFISWTTPEQQSYLV